MAEQTEPPARTSDGVGVVQFATGFRNDRGDVALSDVMDVERLERLLASLELSAHPKDVAHGETGDDRNSECKCGGEPLDPTTQERLADHAVCRARARVRAANAMPMIPPPNTSGIHISIPVRAVVVPADLIVVVVTGCVVVGPVGPVGAVCAEAAPASDNVITTTRKAPAKTRRTIDPVIRTLSLSPDAADL
jgi:hypothetical protein